MNASEVEQKVRPSAGNTLTFGITDINKMVKNNVNTKQVYCIPNKTGWKLKNNTSDKLTFFITSLNGRVVCPLTELNPYQMFSMQSSRNVLFVHLKYNENRTEVILPDLK
jgi:hypothetical protein